MQRAEGYTSPVTHHEFLVEHLRLEKHVPSAHAPQLLERQELMAQVIEHAQEEDDVERAVNGRVDVEDRRDSVLDLRLLQLVRDSEGAVIDRMTVGRQDAIGAAPLGLEREEAVYGPMSRTVLPVKSFGNPIVSSSVDGL